MEMTHEVKVPYVKLEDNIKFAAKAIFWLLADFRQILENWPE